MAFLYEFEWDTAKAQGNFEKHGVTFDRAATVFLDPLAVSIHDEEHSEDEVRWITLGKDTVGAYVLVVHTFLELGNGRGRVRMISARKPTKMEVHDYEEQR
jgi:uncharacterized protein